MHKYVCGKGCQGDFVACLSNAFKLCNLYAHRMSIKDRRHLLLQTRFVDKKILLYRLVVDGFLLLSILFKLLQ